MTISHLNLPHGTMKTRIVTKKLKIKNRDAQKKRSGNKVRGVSPEAGRESMVGKICEKIGLEPEVKERGSYGRREWSVS